MLKLLNCNILIADIGPALLALPGSQVFNSGLMQIQVHPRLGVLLAIR